MNVLRMIKMFGWEKRVQQDVDVKREEELKWVWKRALYGLINYNVKYASKGGYASDVRLTCESLVKLCPCCTWWSPMGFMFVMVPFIVDFADY